jgi:hypothetical protein
MLSLNFKARWLYQTGGFGGGSALVPSNTGGGATPSTVQKATLQIDGQDPFVCLFNPTNYTISKTNIWNASPVKGVNVPPVEFGGGNPRQLHLNILLDVSLLGPGHNVRSLTDQLFGMMEVPSGGVSGGLDSNADPPGLTFRWGSVGTFKAVCESLSIAFVLFDSTGEPLRAQVDLALKEAEDTTAQPAQNPTTRAIRGLRVHQIQDGDTLQAIAYNTYGDPARWRDIADINGIDNPFELKRGTHINLPRLET